MYKLKLAKTLILPIDLVEKDITLTLEIKKLIKNICGFEIDLTNKTSKIISLNKYKKSIKKAAFTLGEVLITFTIIGVIAALTLPILYKNIQERQNIAKAKIAISTYEQLITKIKIDENIKIVGDANSNDTNTLVGFMRQGGNCAKGKSYIKIKEDVANSCQFKTYDSIWWDISDVSKTIVAFDKKCKDSKPTNNENNACYNKVFYLTTNEDPEKTYSFIFNDPEGDANAILAYVGLADKKNE